MALWAGRPQEALDAIRREFEGPNRSNSVIFCGWLLAVGMRACADLAEGLAPAATNRPSG